jgi:hypothetical protein
MATDPAAGTVRRDQGGSPGLRRGLPGALAGTISGQRARGSTSTVSRGRSSGPTASAGAFPRRARRSAVGPTRPPRGWGHPRTRRSRRALSRSGPRRPRTRPRPAGWRRVRAPRGARRQRHSSMPELGNRATAPSGVPRRTVRDLGPTGRPRTPGRARRLAAVEGHGHESCGRRGTPRCRDRRAMGPPPQPRSGRRCPSSRAPRWGCDGRCRPGR